MANLPSGTIRTFDAKKVFIGVDGDTFNAVGASGEPKNVYAIQVLEDLTFSSVETVGGQFDQTPRSGMNNALTSVTLLAGGLYFIKLRSFEISGGSALFYSSETFE